MNGTFGMMYKQMKIGDLVKYIFNTEHTELQGIGIITDSGMNNKNAPKNIHGGKAEVYFVRWCRATQTVAGWYPSTCLQVIS